MDYIYGSYDNSIMSPRSKTTNSIIFENKSFDEKLSYFLCDTILPSKSPLNADDPFKYLISTKYISTLTNVTVILLLLRIFP